MFLLFWLWNELLVGKCPICICEFLCTYFLTCSIQTSFLVVSKEFIHNETLEEYILTATSMIKGKNGLPLKALAT